MSFSSIETVRAPAPAATVYEHFCSAKRFGDIMVDCSEITRNCTQLPTPADQQDKALTMRDVCTTDELQRIAAKCANASPLSNGATLTADDVGTLPITAMHFSLNEEITYLGMAKNIPVSGILYFPTDLDKGPRCQFEWRKTDDGLVETRKIRVISSHATTDGADDQEVVSSEIWEDLHGTTSWYLRFFVAKEAAKSHKKVVEAYGDYFRQLQIQNNHGPAE